MFRLCNQISVITYKKKYDRQIFQASAKLIANDSDIDEAFKSVHQSIVITIKISKCTQKKNGDKKWSVAILYRASLFLENISNSCYANPGLW